MFSTFPLALFVLSFLHNYCIHILDVSSSFYFLFSTLFSLVSPFDGMVCFLFVTNDDMFFFSEKKKRERRTKNKGEDWRKEGKRVSQERKEQHNVKKNGKSCASLVDEKRERVRKESRDRDLRLVLLLLLHVSLLSKSGAGRQEVGVLLVRVRLELSGSPQVGGQVGVGLGQSLEASLDEVTHGSGVTGRRRVAVVDTSQGQHLLGGGGGDQTGTSGSGDESHSDGTGLTGDLAGHGVGSAHSGTPVASSHGNQVHLGVQLSTLDGVGNFAGDLHAQTDVAVSITDDDEGLESGSLTGGGLLLDGHDLHDHVAQVGAEGVHDLVLLDGHGEEEDLLDGSDLAALHQTTQLGHRSPSSLAVTPASSSSSSSASAETSSVTSFRHDVT